ncbi:MAG TPA: c-type cytochrome biogenesis protein CcmI [Gammaproteobacteria bacterium]
MMFFIAAALMLLLTVAAVVLPLWRARVPERAGSVAANREVHAARLKELEEDLANGRLSPFDHAAARRDLERDLSAGPDHDATLLATQPRKVTALVAALLLIVTGSVLYGFYGNWRVGSEGVQAASTQAVLDMVAALDKRLHSPAGQGDLQGWDMLGHSYMIMGRYPDAMQAFAQARRLTDDSNPQELASYAEALTLSHPDDSSVFMTQAMPLFEKTLTLDPHNSQALWYGGLGALKRGDKSLALQRWNAILAQDPPADYRQYIVNAITQVGGTPAVAVAAVSIKVHVSMASAMTASVTPDETVFVYVQPKDGAGGPPLAAKRLQVKDLPVDLSLGDQDAVMPGRVISSYGAVTITARISKSGTVAPQPGDISGRAEWSKAADKPVTIVISKILK